MMAAHKLRQNGGLLLALLLLFVGVLSACERQLQNSGINLLPGNDAEEVGESEVGVVDAPTSEAAEPVETEPRDDDRPVSGIPADDPAPLPGADEVAATEESPRPTDDQPDATQEAAAEATEEVAGEATEEATQEAAEEATQEATAEPEAEATEEEAATAETAEAEAAATEETEAEAAEETAAEETTAEEVAEATQSPAAQERTHVVQPGENLYRIGLQYGISWLALANHNNLPNANAIYAGQELRIPAESGAGAPTPTPPPAAETTYVVQAGDTLYRIGQLFDMSWVTIAQANGLVNPNHIFVGQQLKIPAGGATPNPQLTHTVQPRETLFLISLHYGVPWRSIASANNLSAPYMIYPGQTLVIPGATQ
jgi:LysM repeat protein